MPDKKTVFLLCALVGVVFSLLWPQELISDVMNYHFYNPWALMNGETFKQLAPASLHSFLNPLVDLPCWFFITYFNDFPEVYQIYQGLWAGGLFFVTILITQKLFHLTGIRGAFFWGMSFIVSFSGFAVLKQIGTSTNEIQIATLFLTAFYFLFNTLIVKKEFSFWPLTLSSFLLGALVGLKLTVFFPVLALGVTLFLFCLKRKGMFKWFLLMAGAVLTGYLTTNGWWMFLLWKHYQNPFLPLFNNFFRSPFFQPGSYRDPCYLPMTLFEGLFYPFLHNSEFQNACSAEIIGRHWQMGIGLISAVILSVGLLFPSFRKKFPAPGSFVLVFFMLGYVLWLSSTSIVRYAVSLEVLCGPLCVFVLFYFCSKKGLRYFVALGILAALGWSALTWEKWAAKKDFPKKILYIQDIVVPDETVVLLAYRFTSILIPYIQTTAPIVPIFQEMIDDRGTRWAPHEMPGFSARITDILNRYEKFVLIGALPPLLREKGTPVRSNLIKNQITHEEVDNWHFYPKQEKEDEMTVLTREQLAALLQFLLKNGYSKQEGRGLQPQ